MNPPKSELGLVIPYEKLSTQALHGLIEEVVTRNGTDNGYIQATLEQNVARVMDQLRRKEVVVVFDETHFQHHFLGYFHDFFISLRRNENYRANVQCS